MPFFGRFMVTWKNPLPDEERKEWSSFSVKSASGAVIQGLWATSKTQSPAGVMVLGHPMGKEAKGYFLKNGYGDLYRNAGFHVIIFDINGFGESSHGNFLYYEDIIAVGNVARMQFPGLPIGYHGISMGAQWGIVSFTKEHNYHFAIIESAPATLEEFWIRFPLAYRTLKLLSVLMPDFSTKIRMIDRISETKNLTRVLFIYSQADEYSPVSMGERFLKQSNTPAELWTVETAEHAKIMKSADKELYEKKLVEFVTKSATDR